MIISASRRTDIPAFYTPWLMNRFQAGYCAVPNPFNRNQVSYIDLRPESVEALIFWTRNPRPLFPHLQTLDTLGYRYYFQFTIVNNPAEIDPKTPPLDAAIKTFMQLSQQVGADRVIWRYDPIVFSPITSVNFHIENYRRIATMLHGHTRRSVISIVDPYSKAKRRFADLEQQGIPITEQAEDVAALIPTLREIATAHSMEIQSCAETIDLSSYGVLPGKCVDDVLIHKLFGSEVGHKKDSGQREACGCVESRDIGMYDSCLFGCTYCYATSSFAAAHTNHANHDPKSPSLVGWYDAVSPPEKPVRKNKPAPNNTVQLTLDLE